MVDLILNILHYTISFIVVLSVIVFVHEFGHYQVAKFCGVKATDFSIGFGKKLFSRTDKNGTEWKICAIPLGGYVKFLGDNDPASLGGNDKLDVTERQFSFQNKPLLAKAAIVAAGPLANFLFSLIILTMFLYSNGTFTASNVVSKVIENGPASKAGLTKGDKIIEIEGKKIDDFFQIERIVTSSPNISLVFKVRRNNEELQFELVPKAESVIYDGREYNIGKIGIMGEGVVHKELSLFAATRHAVGDIIGICDLTLKAIGQMFKGQRSSAELEGPIGIAKIAGDTTKKGLSFTLWLMALLSINLGFINLLPIPVLDGGHLLFYIIETIAGKKVVLSIQKYATTIGFMIIVLLSIFALTNDIAKLKLF